MCVRGYAHALAPLGACSIDLNYTYFLIPLPAATAKGFPEFPLLKWMDAHTSHTSLHLFQTDSWTAGQCWTWEYIQRILRRSGIRSYTLFAPCLFDCWILIAMFVHDLPLLIRLKILHSGLCSSTSLPLFYLDPHSPAFTSTEIKKPSG